MSFEKEYVWKEQHYQKLIGYKIQAVGFREELNELWTYLTLESPTGDLIDAYLYSDEEGNHPGFLYLNYLMAN
jgi:hypothetical protein